MPGPEDTVLTLPHQTTRIRRKSGILHRMQVSKMGILQIVGIQTAFLIGSVRLRRPPSCPLDEEGFSLFTAAKVESLFRSTKSLQELQVSFFLFPSSNPGPLNRRERHESLRARIAILKNRIIDSL